MKKCENCGTLITGDNRLCIYCKSMDECIYKEYRLRTANAKIECQYCRLIGEFTPELYDYVRECSNLCEYYEGVIE